MTNSSSPRCLASHTTDIELIIEFAIAVPSMVLYALYFVVYFKSFQLRSSYYFLFFVHSIINIVFLLSRALIMRVTSSSSLCQWFLDHFGEYGYAFTPLYFLYHYMQHAQAISIIAININRVFAIYFYNSFRLLHYATYVLLGSIILLPLPLTWHLLISPVKFIPSPPMIAMDYKRIIGYPGLSFLHLIVDTVATGIVAGTSVLILSQMKTLQRRRKTNERSLIIVSLCLSFGLLLAATVQYLIYTLDRPSVAYYFVLNHRWIIVNFVSLFPPWSLLLLSSVVRTEMYRVATLQGVTPRNSTLGAAALPARKAVTLPLGIGSKDKKRIRIFRGSIPKEQSRILSVSPTRQRQYHLIPPEIISNNLAITENVSLPSDV